MIGVGGGRGGRSFLLVSFALLQILFILIILEVPSKSKIRKSKEKPLLETYFLFPHYPPQMLDICNETPVVRNAAQPQLLASRDRDDVPLMSRRPSRPESARGVVASTGWPASSPNGWLSMMGRASAAGVGVVLSTDPPPSG